MIQCVRPTRAESPSDPCADGFFPPAIVAGSHPGWNDRPTSADLPPRHFFSKENGRLTGTMIPSGGGNLAEDYVILSRIQM